MKEYATYRKLFPNEKNPDVINYARLPSTEGMELDYQSSLYTQEQQNAHAAQLIFVISVAVFLTMIGLRFLSEVMNLTIAIISAASGGLVILAAFFLMRRPAPWLGYAIVTALAIPPLLLFLANATQSAFFTRALGLITAGFLVLMVEELNDHYRAAILSNHRLKPDTRSEIRTWEKNYRKPEGATTRSSLIAEGQDGRLKAVLFDAVTSPTRLSGWFLILAWGVVLYALPLTEFRATVAVAIPLVLLVRGLLAHNFLPDEITTVRNALYNWLTYGRGVTYAPGVFRSPCGSYHQRLLKVGLAFFLIALTFLPATHYLQVPYEATKWMDAWQETYDSASSVSVTAAALRLSNIPPSADPVPFATFMNNVQVAWLSIALDGLFQGKPLFLLPLTVGALLIFLWPLVLLIAITTAVYGNSLSTLESHCEHQAREAEDQPIWESRVQRLLASADSLEKKHLWLGVQPEDDYPVLIDQEILTEHSYIVGDSGSGKTALGVAPIVTQLIRQGDAAVVILDLKGDKFLFEQTRSEAAAAQRTFKFFTNELGASTHTFNPFRDANAANVTLNQVCETILEALNLNHGEGYGRSYYSRVARRWLSAILRSRPNLESFDELFKLSQKRESFTNDEERRDAFELISVIESLASFQQLNITSSQGTHPPSVAEGAIHFPEVLSDKEVVYFWLPSAIETASVREIAKLALYSLLTSSVQFQRQHKHSQRTFLVIDEFQRVASENFKIILEQARSYGIGAILANQTFADLQTNDTDLRPTVQSNSRLKLTFSSQDTHQQSELITASGEKLSLRRSFTTAQTNSETAREVVTPRIDRNDIIQISDDPNACLCHVARGSGYTQFSGFSIPVHLDYCVSKDTYDALLSLPWPEATNATIQTKRAPLEPQEFATPEARLAAAGIIVDETPAASAVEEPTSAPSAGIDWKKRLQDLAEERAKTKETG